MEEAILEGSLTIGADWPGFSGGVPDDAENVRTDFFLLEGTDEDPATRDEFLVDVAFSPDGR